MWEFASVKTLTVDDHNRIRIPDAKPRQVFAYENHGDGRRTLTLLEAETKEPFPPGSLKKYLTKEYDEELSALANGSSLPQLREPLATGRITNVDPLPDHVMDRIYSQPDDDPEGTRKFIAAQSFDVNE